jgi:DNA-binding IclR family transcriptional regulator
MATATRSRSRKSQTVERAGLVLACFSAAKPHLSLAELAGQLELNPSTVYRYAVALQEAGLLERDERRGGYRLGLRVVELAGIVLNQLEVRKQALDEMDHLRDDTDLHTSLGVLFEGDVLYLAASSRRDLPALYTGIGRRQPAHCAAMGKLLLAELSDEAAVALVDRYGWRTKTPRSVNNAEALRRELAEIRQRGYAVADEDLRLGVAALAMPVRDYSGAVQAALGVTGPRTLLNEPQREQVLMRLQVAASRISFRLGYHEDVVYG